MICSLVARRAARIGRPDRMNPLNPQRPGGGVGAGPTARAALQERVRELSALSSISDTTVVPTETDDKAILADDYFKQTLQIVAAVFLGSLFASSASSPTFDAPNAWGNSFRFDTALALVWGPVLAWTMARLKLHRAIRIYLVLCLFIEPFSEVLFRQTDVGFWDSILWPAAAAWYGTLKEWSGLPGGSIPVFLLVTLGLLYRGYRSRRFASYVRPPKFARNYLLMFLGTIIVLAAWGLARGGGVQAAFRQGFHLLQLPLIALVFLYALRIPEDLGAIGTIFVSVGVVRALYVVFIYYGIAAPQGITDIPGRPEWCTTHSDSVLFVTAILVAITHAFEQRRARTILRAALVTAVIFVAILLNNRRLAFVSLSIAPAIVYLALKPSKRKRRVTAALTLLVPLAIGYVLVASEINSTSALVKPAKAVMSMLDDKDLSSASRDVENENLIYTLRQNPIVPTGFGFEYQYSPDNPPVDLTEVFANFRLIAHNGVLWIWAWGGLIGFTMLWSVFSATGTLAMRGYRNAETPVERAGALSALGTVAICIVQYWGDQGLNSYTTLVTFGVAFAVATRLAVRVRQPA
jgi:hypothetical protein